MTRHELWSILLRGFFHLLMERGMIKTHLGIFLLIITTLLLVPANAGAELFKWTDEDGVVHITDDLGKVPEEVRGDVRRIETTPPERAYEPPPYIPDEAGPELYGGKTLQWWADIFKKKDAEIGSIEARIASKRQYIEVFEGGRRFGQTFGPDEVDRYERLKKEISEDTSRLQELRDELSELRRKATSYGVPREVRGE